MGGWKKWAGFVIWCVLLFGGMIAAGTDLWPLGVAAVHCPQRPGSLWQVFQQESGIYLQGLVSPFCELAAGWL